jgi:diaminohydroxyphosphoribosylaminopyrimidine deaminase/5-amino-6-(5-phosphoribosylamino)uracil reductase
MPPTKSEDEAHLRRALALARRGQGYVEPNPLVGCVLVKRGRVIGAGCHRRFGGPHAEVEALRSCTESPRGATVYVTLEPCCHWGKTPPCVDALIEARVARVVAPLADPNPQVAGRGFARLKRAGVRVDVGLLHKEAAELHAPFIKLIHAHRPWVILKWAQSLDGRIATRTGDSRWITDEVCRRHAHRVRARMDAILVGVETVLRDDPLLTCRAGRPRRIATRVILDTHLRTPPRAKLVRTARDVPTWIFCGRNVRARRTRALERAGCVIRPVASSRNGVSLPAVLDALGAASFTNVLVEGGGRVLGRFFDAGLADELHIYVAPLLVGGRDAPGPLGGLGPRRVRDALRWPGPLRFIRLGDGGFVCLRTDTVRSGRPPRR